MTSCALNFQVYSWSATGAYCAVTCKFAKVREEQTLRDTSVATNREDRRSP